MLRSGGANGAKGDDIRLRATPAREVAAADAAEEDRDDEVADCAA
jgi:hypothetical protein